MINRYPLGTVEYISATVTADVVLDAQAVALSIDGGTTWLTGAWQDAPGTTRVVRTASPITFNGARRTVTLLIKVTATPEVPIIKAGTLEIG